MENANVIRYEPLMDSVFSYLFSDKSTNISVEEIINNVLTSAGDPPIKAVTSVDSQYSVIGEKIGARGGRLDVRAVADDNTLFDIEVQLSRQLFMNDRSWFYGSRLLSEAFREGEDYRQMPRVRVINLLDFTLRDAHPDYLQPIGVMYKKPPVEVATEAFRIYNIELPKFRERHPTLESVLNDPLARWLYLLVQGYKDEREMEVLMNLSEGMKAFAEKYSLSLDDPRLRGLYEYDLSARRDQAEIAHTARELGEALGEKRGSMLERIATIRNMLGIGMPVNMIYNCFDAPRAEIDAIIADLSAANGA